MRSWEPIISPSAGSQAVADLPIGARSGLPLHGSHRERIVPVLILLTKSSPPVHLQEPDTEPRHRRHHDQPRQHRQ